MAREEVAAPARAAEGVAEAEALEEQAALAVALAPSRATSLWYQKYLLPADLAVWCRTYYVSYR